LERPLAKRRVLVTGEQGFIGSHFMNSDASIETIPFGLDILKWDEVYGKIQATHPDVILHLAGISLPAQCDQDPPKAYQVNLVGANLILEAMLKLKSNARFIFASTAQVYQPLQKGSEKPITELHPIEPINLYARTKRMAEISVEEFSKKYGLKTSILRFFNHVHSSQKTGTFLSTIYQAMFLQKDKADPVSIPVGNLELYRDMGSVGDLMAALSAVVSHSEKMRNFEVFNICNGHARNLNQLANALAKELGVKAEFKMESSRIRENDPHTVVGSHEKLTQVTGWKPVVKSDEELIRAFLKEG
jgi:GDP-4-dehydro-6-deoxy-D-mannose reductase